MKLSELAKATGATCAASDADIEVSGAAGLDQASKNFEEAGNDSRSVTLEIDPVSMM